MSDTFTINMPVPKLVALPELLARINDSALVPTFSKLYGDGEEVLQRQQRRYTALVRRFAERFPQCPCLGLFSAPGRTEVGGNHTDHNGGRVLAAAVDLDIVAVAAPADDSKMVIESDGYAPICVDTRDLGARSHERYQPEGIVRGVAARLHALGYRIGGLRACANSTVPTGAGLSSSAAFEVLIATMLNCFYNKGHIDPLTVAKVSQYAENNYFGKPCGLMDQTACAVGGLLAIDFSDFEHPIVQTVTTDFRANGYSMVIVDTGGNHAHLNDDYVALEDEMKSVARALGTTVLRQLTAKDVLKSVARLRSLVGDRAILRALHFYAEDCRVVKQVEALRREDFKGFLALVIESGQSSWMLCQNCYSASNVREQGISIALVISASLLSGRGAWRVHGGGFAGTIQAFVPLELVDEYTTTLEAIFGAGACHSLTLRPTGAESIDLK